ncbi:MAG: glycosyltransferase family 4 protein [Eubacteriales bacterium]|nr:glycosyltransferase family 4 protein [Eubacteriales bacterium]
MERRIRVCMIVPQSDVKGGIAAVVNGYRGSRLEQDCEVRYVESYCDGGRLRKFGKALCAYLLFHRELRKHRPDVVHIHSSFGPSFYRKMPFILMSAGAGIPIVNHIHGSAIEELYERAPGWKQSLVRNIYGKCATIIVLSHEWKERIAQIVPRERIVIVENYSVLSVKAPTKESAASKQILFLGVIEKDKGCFDFPAIMEEVRAEVPQARLLSAGVGDIHGVQNLLRQRGQEEAVLFPGWIRGQEKDRALRESAVFLLPSYHEAMPMSVLEAMGYGLPIVSTNVGGIPRLVEEGRNGFLLAPGDTAGMAKALVCLLNEEERRERYGKESLRLVREKFGLEEHISRLEKIYGRVLKQAETEAAKAGE